MDLGNVEFDFVASASDPEPHTPEYQSGLWEVTDQFRGLELKPSCSVFVQDDAASAMTHLGQITMVVAPAVVGAVAAIVGAWLQARYGRKVRIKMGEIEAEATSVEEIKELLKAVEAYAGGKVE